MSKKQFKALDMIKKRTFYTLLAPSSLRRLLILTVLETGISFNKFKLRLIEYLSQLELSSGEAWFLKINENPLTSHNFQIAKI